MENKVKRISAVLLALLLLSLPLLTLTGCEQGGEVSQAPSKAPEKTEYLLTLQTQGGMPLPQVLVKVFGDTTCTDLVYAAMTDREGLLRFTAPESDSYVAVAYLQEPGYTPLEYYPVRSTNTTMLVETAPYAAENFEALSLRTGDIFPNVSITCADGTVYSIKELLAEKKAVVLNFWFLGCDPCRMEFPYLQDAYLAYMDSLEVIAINPYDGNDETVSQYAAELNLTFPVAAGIPQWQSVMNLMAYPTTVVIDRYGMICLTHIGSVTDDETFRHLFAYVTSDDYVQKVYRSIEEMNP